MIAAMTSSARIAALILALVACWPTLVFAQRPAAVKADANATNDADQTNEDVAPPDSAVAAILAAKPTTPAECVQAAKTLVDLGHMDVAKKLLKQVVDAKLPSAQLAELGQQFGAAMFIDLGSRPSLQPEAKQLADAVLSARKAQLEDTKRIDGLIQQLQDPDEEKRIAALAGLQEARTAAIGPLLSVLADPARAAEHANVRTVLATMGSVSRGPLLAVLDTADAKLKVQAILALEEMNSPKAVLPLLEPSLSAKSDAEVRQTATAALRRLTGSEPSRPEAIKLLADAAKNYFDRRQPIEGVADERVEIWSWDEAKRRCIAQSGTPEDAARYWAARYARNAYSIDGNDPAIRRLYLATMLDAAAYANGLDRPWDENSAVSTKAKRFGPKTLDDVLAYSIEHQHPAAATAAARLLGAIGSASELLYQGDKPSPLVRALQDPDRRLRMAALQAIVRLQPSRPYAGSSRVPAALAYFAASSGMRRAIVAATNIEQSRDMAGMLATAGLETDTAATGAELLRQATRSPDYEVAWIDVSINHPEIGTVLQELRRDPRTATLPIGVLARSGQFELADHMARLDPMAKAFARPHDLQAFRWQLQQLTALAPSEFVDFAIRQQQASEALDLLAELSRSSSKIYDLRGVQSSVLAALYNPKLAIKAVTVLASLNSAAVQRALVDIASRFTNPLELRQAAATAFRENTEKYGILLTIPEIEQQYRRYNDSKTQDAATQRVLGLILDCLEARAGVNSRDRASGQRP